MKSGGTPSRSKSNFWNGGKIPWAKISDLESSPDGFINNTEEYITEESLISINNRFFEKGTLLLAMYGSVGKVTISDIELSSNQAILGIVPKKDKLDTKYLFYWFKNVKEKLLDRAVGVALSNISKTIVSNLEIPLPSLSEQKSIAAQLDKADELIRYNRQLIEKYDELQQSLFLDMFGDPVMNEKGWKTVNIKDLVTKDKYSIKRGPFGGALKKEIFVDEGYLVYEQYHALNDDYSMMRYFINDKKFEELKAFEVKPKDIIISCSGVYLGRLSIIPENAKRGIINQALLKLTLNQNIIKNIFFVFHFSNRNFKNKYFDSNRGAGIPNFPPMSEFRKFPFILPPIELQNEFASHITSIEYQKELVKEAIA